MTRNEMKMAVGMVRLMGAEAVRALNEEPEAEERKSDLPVFEGDPDEAIDAETA
jgi:hypothetical protein